MKLDRNHLTYILSRLILNHRLFVALLYLFIVISFALLITGLVTIVPGFAEGSPPPVYPENSTNGTGSG